MKDIKMQQNNSIGLYLMGTTASGRGAFGNFIVGDYVFRSTSRIQHSTAVGPTHYARRWNRTIAICEGPDFENIHLSPENSRAFVTSVEQFMRAMEGFYIRYVFVFVVRYGERYTADMNMVHFTKSVLGKDLFKKHAFIVMTSGEVFQNRHGPGQQVFTNWCRSQQDGDLRDLMEESQWRVHLFSDMSRFEDGLENQLQQLIDSIDNHAEMPYTMNNNYNRAADSRKKAVVSAKKCQLEEETEDKIQRLLNRLDRTRRLLQPLDQLSHLQGLETEVTQLVNRIRIEDDGTGILNHSSMQAKLADRCIKDAVVVCKNLIDFENRGNVVEGRMLRLIRNQVIIKIGLLCLVGFVIYQTFGRDGCFCVLSGAGLFCFLICRFYNTASRVHILTLLTILLAYFISFLLDS